MAMDNTAAQGLARRWSRWEGRKGSETDGEQTANKGCELLEESVVSGIFLFSVVGGRIGEQKHLLSLLTVELIIRSDMVSI